MKIRGMLLGLAVAVASCARPTWPRVAPVGDDSSIIFPSFSEHPVVRVGSGLDPYEVDGVVLRAIMIAMTDFLRPGVEERPCWGSPEAHRYRVIRREDIIFVRIDEDLEACGLQYISVDTGVEYAISTDGRILRRIFDGEPSGRLKTGPVDAGVAQDAGVPRRLLIPPVPGNGKEDASVPTEWDGGSAPGHLDSPAP